MRVAPTLTIQAQFVRNMERFINLNGGVFECSWATNSDVNNHLLCFSITVLQSLSYTTLEYAWLQPALIAFRTWDGSKNTFDQQRNIFRELFDLLVICSGDFTVHGVLSHLPFQHQFLKPGSLFYPKIVNSAVAAGNFTKQQLAFLLDEKLFSCEGILIAGTRSHAVCIGYNTNNQWYSHCPNEEKQTYNQKSELVDVLFELGWKCGHTRGQLMLSVSSFNKGDRVFNYRASLFRTRYVLLLRESFQDIVKNGAMPFIIKYCPNVLKILFSIGLQTKTFSDALIAHNYDNHVFSREVVPKDNWHEVRAKQYTGYGALIDFSREYIPALIDKALQGDIAYEKLIWALVFDPRHRNKKITLLTRIFIECVFCKKEPSEIDILITQKTIALAEISEYSKKQFIAGFKLFDFVVALKNHPTLLNACLRLANPDYDLSQTLSLINAFTMNGSLMELAPVISEFLHCADDITQFCHRISEEQLNELRRNEKFTARIFSILFPNQDNEGEVNDEDEQFMLHMQSIESLFLELSVEKLVLLGDISKHFGITDSMYFYKIIAHFNFHNLDISKKILAYFKSPRLHYLNISGDLNNFVAFFAAYDPKEYSYLLEQLDDIEYLQYLNSCFKNYGEYIMNIEPLPRMQSTDEETGLTVEQFEALEKLIPQILSKQLMQKNSIMHLRNRFLTWQHQTSVSLSDETPYMDMDSNQFTSSRVS